MATANDLIGDWASANDKRATFFNQTKGRVVRWLNEAQLRFCDKSEMLKGIWRPTLTSSGSSPLPDDCLKIVKDTVKWDSRKFLVEASYPEISIINPSGTEFYSIWDNTFYVFGPSAGTPTIPYIRKPDEILVASIANEELEIPTEFHHELIMFLDAMWKRQEGDDNGYYALIQRFDQKATEAGMKFISRNQPAPRLRASRFG